MSENQKLSAANVLQNHHIIIIYIIFYFFFSSRRRHTRYWRDWSSDVCSSDLGPDRPDDDEGYSRPEEHAPVVQGDPVGEGDRLAAGHQGVVAPVEIGRASCRERV